jgi:hypothetical protein
MPFITFIYTIGKKRFYGKYVADYVSDDHEGLDDVVQPIVLKGVNAFRKQKGLSSINRVKIGILSLSVDNFVPCYSSEKEMVCFDFYCDEQNYYEQTIYVNGQKIRNE